MAIDKHTDSILTSIHGKRLGLDDQGSVAGVSGVRMPHESATDGSTMSRHGMSVHTSSAAATVTLPAPLKVGVEKTFINASTGASVALTVVRSTAEGACSFYFSTGTEVAGTTLTLSLRGAAASLVSISTDKWALLGTRSTAYVAVSTST